MLRNSSNGSGGSAGGNFILMAVAGWPWHGSVENRSKEKEKWKVVVKFSQKMYNCNKCVSQLCIFFADYILFCSCAIFLAVVLISCMIPTYECAVVPFFCSCTFIFAVVQFTPRPNFNWFRTTLNHKHTSSLVISRYARVVFSWK